MTVIQSIYRSTGESIIMYRFSVVPFLIFAFAMTGCANAATPQPGIPLKNQTSFKTTHPLKASHHFVIQTQKNILLSSTLKHFLARHGWSMVWNDPFDDLVQYPHKYVSKTLTGVLREVLLAYHLTVVMKKGNQVAIIHREESHD